MQWCCWSSFLIGTFCNRVQETLTDMRQQVERLQLKINDLQQQHVHTSVQRDAEILDLQRQKESLASSEAALEAAQQQLRNAHLEIEVTAWWCRWLGAQGVFWRFSRPLQLCCYRTAVHGSKQLRKKSRKQKLNSRSCRYGAIFHARCLFVTVSQIWWCRNKFYIINVISKVYNRNFLRKRLSLFIFRWVLWP